MKSNTQYKITLYNNWKAPYFLSTGKEVCLHECNDNYIVKTKKMCKEIIRDFLDVPESEMTIEQIKKDFTTPTMDVPEKKLVQIQNYFNGRLALYNRIIIDLKDLFIGKTNKLKYDIPSEYNQFSLEDDKVSKKFIQLGAFISVEVIDAK